ncbi:MAG: V0D/AC39 family V-type ATPase subunit [Candidatus Ranarchaeia archaeon]
MPNKMYSQLAVKVGSERTKLLPTELLRQLAESTTLDSFISKLRGTVYRNHLSALAGIDVHKLQFAIEEELIRVYTSIIKTVPEKARFFFREYVSWLEISNLMVLLRSKISKKLTKSVEEHIHLSIESLLGRASAFDDAVKAQDIMSTLKVFDKTIYGHILEEGRKSFQETGSIAYFEQALERSYYDRLLRSTHDLKGTDRYIAKEFVGPYLDTFNIVAIIRSKVLDIPDYLIYRKLTNRFYRLSEANVHRLVSAGSLDEVIRIIKSGPYGRYIDQQFSNETLRRFQNMLRRYSIRWLKRESTRNIFSLATPLRLFIEKKDETDKLRHISSGIALKWSPKKITSFSMIS